MSGAEFLSNLIRERGPLTVAAFMDAALYDPDFGYYARTAQRSGRAGDFFTNVDVGPLFGQLLAVQISEMAEVLALPAGPERFDLVEAGAGNGRLMSDLLQSLGTHDIPLFKRLAVHPTDRSALARAAQRETLRFMHERLVSSTADLPQEFEGVLIANELLDAMPAHQVVMRRGGLKEVFVGLRDGQFVESEGSLSTPDLQRYLDRCGISPALGQRLDVNLASIAWVQDAVRRLRRGFVILIDYGYTRDRRSPTLLESSLTSYRRHRATSSERPRQWLEHPGEQDLTTHVDFSSIREAAEAGECTTVGLMDQTYFLLALACTRLSSLDLHERQALRTLTLPGGLGSTMKVLVLAKNVGATTLIGCAGPARFT